MKITGHFLWFLSYFSYKMIVFLLKFLLLLELASSLSLACGLIASSSLGRFSILLLANYSNLSNQDGLTKQLRKVNNRTIILCSIFCVLWFLPAGLPALIFTIILVCTSTYFFAKFIVPFNQGLSGDILGMSVVLVEIFSLLVITASFSWSFLKWKTISLGSI